MTSFSPIHSDHPPQAEIGYRAVNFWAVVSLILGLLSVAAAFDRLLIVVPAAGVLAGWRALKQLRYSQGTQTGVALARVGIAASVLFAVGGALFLSLVMNDVPHGYTEITFDDLQPKSGEAVSRYAMELQPTMRDDRRVFIRGFIYPGRRSHEIKEFMLVPTVGHCSFCARQMRPTEMIRVVLTGSRTVDFRSTEIAVGGRLRVDQLSSQTPYSLETDYVQ